VELPGGSHPGASAGWVSEAAAESPRAAADAADANVAHALSGDGKLYALSANRGLQILDLSKLDAPSLLGRLPVAGVPVALHLSGSTAFIVLHDADAPRPQSSSGAPVVATVSRLWAVDVSKPAAPRVVSRTDVGGPLLGSHLVGHVLYTLTSGPAAARMVLAAHDLRDPTSPKAAARAEMPDKPTLAEFGEGRLTVAWSSYSSSSSTYSTTFQIYDLTDADGAVSQGARFEQPGLLRSMRHEADRKLFGAVLVPSDYADGATVALWSTPTPTTATPAGSATTSDPVVRWARFDAARVWLVSMSAVSSSGVVRLVDTTNPTLPAVSAPVQLPPEFSNAFVLLQARGARLFALAHPDASNAYASPPIALAVVDGTTAASPRLVGSAVLAQGASSSSASSSGGPSSATTDTWSASQSDPEKAFQVLDAEGLVAVPTMAPPTATRWTGHLSLLDLSAQGLAPGGVLPYAPGARALALPGRAGQLALVSAERLSIVDASDRAARRVRAELELSTRVNAVAGAGARAVLLAGTGDRAELRVTDAQAPDGPPLARVRVPGAWLMHQAGSVAWVLGRALTAVDLADPLDPQVLGTLDLVAASASAGGAWGYASEYAFQGRTLVVHRSGVNGGGPFTISDGPVQASQTSQSIGMLCGGPATAAFRVRSAALADAGAHDLLVFDLSAPRAPRLAARVPLPGTGGFGLTLSGGFAWTMRREGTNDSQDMTRTGRSFTDAVDLSDPAHPALRTLNVPGVVVAAEDGGKRFYTLDHVDVDDGRMSQTGNRRTDVHALELTDHGTARLVATLHVPGAETGFARVGGRAYLTAWWTLATIDLATFKLVSQQSVPGHLRGAAGGKLFFAGEPGLLVYGLGDPDRPKLELGALVPGWTTAGSTAAVESGAAYLPQGAGGITRLPLGP
jgi:hypothetical protein